MDFTFNKETTCYKRIKNVFSCNIFTPIMGFCLTFFWDPLSRPYKAGHK